MIYPLSHVPQSDKRLARGPISSTSPGRAVEQAGEIEYFEPFFNLPVALTPTDNRDRRIRGLAPARPAGVVGDKLLNRLLSYDVISCYCVARLSLTGLDVQPPRDIEGSGHEKAVQRWRPQRAVWRHRRSLVGAAV